MKLAWIDILLIAIYCAFVLAIGFLLRRQMVGSAEFFMAGRSMPAWVAGLAFLSANLGAQEMIGMAASGAKYGILTSHFYWVGAIPAMAFVGVFMMPFYYGSRARSVPEYLKLRFDEKTRGFNALTFAVMTVFSSGHQHVRDGRAARAAARVEHSREHRGVGSRRAAVHRPRRPDERDLQRGAAVLPHRLRLPPVVYLGLRDAGGWSGLAARVPETFVHSWAYLGRADANPMGVEWFGMVMGLGFVLSFGYWCTDFLVVQRAMAADSMNAARRTPLIAAVPKMLFPFLVIVPGIVALGLTLHPNPGAAPLLPTLADGTYDYNMALPLMMSRYYPAGLLGLGLTALLASFMSGMAGNVTAFNTVWTFDIYQSYIRPRQSDAHYLWMGRMATVVRRARQHRDRVCGDALQQHHGHAAAGVLVRERAAVRDVSARHVLEAHDRTWRVLGPRRGDRRRRAALRAHERDGGPHRFCRRSRSCIRIRRTWRRTSGAPSSRGPPASWPRRAISLVTTAKADGDLRGTGLRPHAHVRRIAIRRGTSRPARAGSRRSHAHAGARTFCSGDACISTCGIRSACCSRLTVRSSRSRARSSAQRCSVST